VELRVVNLREPAFRLQAIVIGITFWPVMVDEMKLTDAQRARLDEIAQQFRAKQQAARRGPDFEKAALANLEAAEAAIRAALEPRQWARFEQIRLRMQGPTAFTLPELTRQLGLAPEQIERAGEIVAKGAQRQDRASTVALAWEPGRRPKTMAEVRDYVATPEFRASKEAAWRRFFEARTETLRQVEAILTDAQKAAYHERLGPPLDAIALWAPMRERDVADAEAMLIARTIGVEVTPDPQQNTGQRSDPTFDTKVAKPAYAGEKHPKVLFDEAHYNFHTATGRYKAFAVLISNDGYKLTRNREPFQASSLADSDILVIANALGAEGMGHPDAAKSAFTDAECDAVRDWVDAGGSLLLITDHQPFGDAADTLAKRFGVDMSKGVARDEANEQERGLLFSREKGLIGDHAITRGRDDSERVDRVLTFTGQSLKGPPGSVAVLKFSGTAVDRRQDGNPVTAAGRAQGIAFAHGKGRVVVMGEAAQLSAQVFGLPPIPMGMNVPGCDNRRMALNTMHWLSRLID
jgi:hypothetical protein